MSCGIADGLATQTEINLDLFGNLLTMDMA
jgi:hypothetical protein